MRITAKAHRRSNIRASAQAVREMDSPSQRMVTSILSPRLCFDLVGRPRLSHVRGAVIALALTDLAIHSVKASALFDLLAPPLGMASFSVVLPQLGTPSTRADFLLLACRVPSCWRTHCEPVEAMHAVGGRSGVEDVIVAEDFTFAAASAMADEV